MTTSPRARGRRAPAAQSQTQPEAPAFVFSRPVEVDLSKFEIPDMKLFARMPQAETDDALRAQLIPEIIDMLDRVVVGGTAGRPATEFWLLLAEVNKAITGATDAKN